MTAVIGVEMRRIVIVVVHSYKNAEKFADGWHVEGFLLERVQATSERSRGQAPCLEASSTTISTMVPSSA